MININPSKSMRSMAAKLGVGKRIIQWCVDEDLHCKSYRMQIGPAFDPGDQGQKPA